MEIFKIIIDNIKNRKIFWVILIASALIYLKNYYKPLYLIIIKIIEDLINLISKDILSFAIGSISLLVLFILLKYSDMVKEKDYKSQNFGIRTEKSDDKNPFELEICENTLPLLWNQMATRECSIINNTGDEILYVEGVLSFYKAKKRFHMINFKVEKLKNTYGHIFSTEMFKDYIPEWEEFDFYIVSAKYNDKEISNKRYCGKRYHRILPNLMNASMIEKLIPYNLEWFREKVIREGFNRLRWYFKFKGEFYEKHRTYKTTLYRFKNLIRIVFILLFGISLSIALIYFIAELLIMIINALIIILSSLIKIF
jgi:uncharacterized protein YggT (Ycf19 family)